MIITPESLKKEACQNEINAVLAKHGFVLDPFFHCASQGIQMGINLLPNVKIQVPIGEVKADG